MNEPVLIIHLDRAGCQQSVSGLPSYYIFTCIPVNFYLHNLNYYIRISTFIIDMTRKRNILTNLDLELLSLGQEVWLGWVAVVHGG